jgi:hypothetical protein
VGDVCDLGTCSCVAGSRSLPGDAQKLEATGQELRAELLCQAKATTSGGPVDPACITKAATTTRIGHRDDQIGQTPEGTLERQGRSWPENRTRADMARQAPALPGHPEPSLGNEI